MWPIGLFLPPGNAISTYHGARQSTCSLKGPGAAWAQVLGLFTPTIEPAAGTYVITGESSALTEGRDHDGIVAMM